MITAKLVQELREKTNAGMMDCKRALEEAKGDLAAAEVVLRKRGIATAAKKAGRAAKEGAIASYIHLGGKMGVLVEVNCETDFVAKTEKFKDFVKDVALHIAAAKPVCVTREEVPPALLEKEKEIARAQIKGKPPQILEKIVEGKMDKYFSTICLMEQAFIKDPDKTVKDLLTATIAELGENIVVKRFTVYELGQGEAPSE
ncbi:MAG: translation elongation factor Ts [Verrucomicrobiae bacterium]|nr:translation elongation factor Ts [Verrucomicrobiae bacterium]